MKQPHHFHRLLNGLMCGILLLTMAACDNRNIHQVIKEIAEAPVDTTGLSAKTVQTNHFSGVEIDCFADVTFHQTVAGMAPYVSLKAIDEVLDHVSTKAKDDRLVISTDRRYRMPEKAVVIIDIYAPFVSSFMLNGGKCLRLGNLQLSSPLTLEVAGVGALTADSLVCPEITVRLEGAGSVDLKGVMTQRLDASLTGNGQMFFAGQSRTTNVDISGEGTVNTDKFKSDSPIRQRRR